jgi:uncharacterized protein (TIGR03663 family)
LKSYDTRARHEQALVQTETEQSEHEQPQQPLERASFEPEVAEVLPGEEREAIEQFAHNELTLFGSTEAVGTEEATQAEAEQITLSRRFVPPSREQLLNWLPFWGIILLGAILRFWQLGAKPLHHDESLHAYFSLQLLHNLQNWSSCFDPAVSCYRYNPLLHGPFQFHAIALVYQISQWLGAPDNGVNTTTVRIAAALLGTVIIGLPYFLRDYIGKAGALLASFLLAVSPSMVYFSRFAREDIYMACFTLLLVVATARYIRTRKMRWIVIGAAAFSLSYATSEATFLTIAVFGSFLGALLMWELGKKWPLRASIAPDATIRRYLPRTAAPVLLVLYFLVLLPVAKIALGWLDALSRYITNPKYTPLADLFVQNLKNITVDIVPWIGIFLGIFVLSILAREMYGKPRPAGRRGLAARIDPQRQPTLDAILTMPWTHWFFALLCAWTIFLVLFTVVFTNIRGGIGDGIWQGLYYWLQQQEVARGGQPWYYYLLLIPLYEQIGVVFGIVGIIRSLLRPSPFRLFLVYWFVGNLFIYSWAAEKMPWLMIFMTMPMMLLAAIGLEPSVVTLFNWVKGWRLHQRTAQETIVVHGTFGEPVARPARPMVGALTGSMATLSVVFAFLLLLPTLHNMYEVSYIHAADGPHEMMVYVQTTTDVNIVMAKINELDQKMDGGNHQLAIGVMATAEWPFAWYLRDYPNVCYGFPTACPSMAKNTPVILMGEEDIASSEVQYGSTYNYQQYNMRTWWDEGYKPPPCVPTKANNECAGQQTYGGVGLGPWLSYGDNPPPGASFNLGLAAKNVWDWWWYRKPIGSTDGTYLMGLFIQKGLGVAP